jgi:hypothetical protein
MRKIIILCILCSCFIIKPSILLSSTNHSVVVLGSEPECITAAVTAYRLGYDVTIITESDRIGGLFIDGMLTAIDINFDYQNEILHRGFFEKFLKACSNGSNIDFEQTKNFFNQLTEKYPIRIVYTAKDIKPIIVNDKIAGVNYISNEKSEKQYCKYVIDGSSEASFTRKLGVPYKKGRTEFGKPNEYAAATLIFSVKDANWNEIISSLENDNNDHTGYRGNAAWGFNIMYKYPASSPRLQMRGLNLSRQNDGSIVINALLIFDVDSTLKKSIDEGYLLARSELPSIVSYLSKSCPGFEKASLDKIAHTLYIREGIRVIGEDTLTGNDILEHTHFPNTIAYGSYPIDLQATRKGEYGSALCGKCLYSIPLGCMLPKGVDNLLLIGRSASFDILAHGSARTIPVLMSMAENGVLAMDYCIKNNISLRTLNRSPDHFQSLYKDIRMQNDFKQLELPKSHTNMNWYYPYIQDLISRGSFGLGYSKYTIDSTDDTKKTLSTILGLFSSNSSYILPKACKELIHGMNEKVKIADLCKVMSYIFEDQFATIDDLYQKNVVDQVVYEHLRHTTFLSHAEIASILDCAIKKMEDYTPIVISNDPLDIINE